MATGESTYVNRDIEKLGVIIAVNKEEVKKQFGMLRENLRLREQNICAKLDDILTSAINSHKCLLRSIEQLELGKSSLEDTLKENHVLNLLEKTVVDLTLEKQRLVEQKNKTARCIQLSWNLEPFITHLDNICTINVSSNECLDKKVVRLRRNPAESFGFVIMTDLSKRTTICRISDHTPAYNSDLKIGDVLLEMNGQDITSCTHNEIVEMIRGSMNLALSIQRISN